MGRKVWRQSERDKTRMVWAYAEEECGVYQEKIAEDGAVRQEEKRTKRRFMGVMQEDM